MARFAPRDRTLDGKPCPLSDVDDWSCLIGEFASGCTGVWEGTTLAKGLRSRRLRPRVGGDQRLGGVGCLPAARAQYDSPGQDGPGPRCGRGSGRISQARRQPARPRGGRTRHGLPLRPDVGVRLGGRGGPPGRSELSRWSERACSWRTPCSSRTRGAPGSTPRWRRPERVELCPAGPAEIDGLNRRRPRSPRRPPASPAPGAPSCWASRWSNRPAAGPSSAVRF